MKKIKKFRIVIIAILLYIVAFILKRDVFNNAVDITLDFFKEMLQVLPPVLVLSALITVWVPASIIEKGLGPKSGIKGKLISILIGSLSAGPIYAAFPAVLVLYKKGASISNMVVILSSWAVIKVPMLVVEANFLGVKFTAVRFLLTVPAILIMGLIIEKLVKKEDIKESFEDEITLPNLNCGGCGYDSCELFKEAIENNDKTIEDCIVLNKRKE